jgi:hypothetical protein
MRILRRGDPIECRNPNSRLCWINVESNNIDLLVDYLGLV